jgi:hypothetical protein
VSLAILRKKKAIFSRKIVIFVGQDKKKCMKQRCRQSLFLRKKFEIIKF